MSKRTVLPELLRDRLAAFPESSFCAHKVALVLRDGRVVEDVLVAWEAEILSAGGRSELPFEEWDIVDILDRSATSYK